VLLASMVVVALAAALGQLCRRFGQAPVVGEMMAGILLGPSVFGVLAPGLEKHVFPASVFPLLNVVAQIGVVFFMFLIGLELPIATLRRVGRRVLPLGHAAIAVPFMFGVVLALKLRDRYQPATVRELPFLLFVALAVSVTALPVLARILSDRDMVGTRIGTLGLAVAGVGDVTAWCVLGVVVAEVRNTSSWGALRTIAEVAALAALLWFGARPLLAALAGYAEERWAGTLPVGTLLTAFVLVCAVLTNSFGVHPIFGAFLAGAVMPRSSRTVSEFALKVEGLAVWLLMPLFFATIGLQTRIQSVFTMSALGALAAVLAVAVVGKVGGAGISARMLGETRRDALRLGVMMNCRGLTELVVLEVGLSLGVLRPALFSVLVVMTLITTIMTDPLLRLVSRNLVREGDRTQRPVVQGRQVRAR
jgi:Kef-type K+ transport system membrane component KefB